MHKRFLAVAAASAAAATLVLPAPALAHGASTPTVTVLTDDVASPFNLEVTRHGVLVADGGPLDGSAPGQIAKLNRDGSLTTVVPDVPGASGVAKSRHGKLAYTTTSETGVTLEIQGRNGHHASADTLAYETANNPDQVITYGIDNPTECQSAALGEQAHYTGGVDSHAYSVTSWRGKWVVADAGGNDLLLIDNRGNISTLAVLPRQPLILTAEIVAGEGLPDCLVGATYNFEAVPTDVEVGRDGSLYVTTLPGGPEDPSLGGRGSVYKVNPWSGHARQLATGLAGATNLALGSHGEIYVTELFGDRISVVKHGEVTPLVDLPGAVAVESAGRHTLYAATLDLSGANPGTVVRIDLPHRHHHGHHGS